MSHHIVVGVDLAIGHLAPLRFAVWWADAYGDREVVAVHVLPASVVDQVALIEPQYGIGQARESLALAVEGLPRPAEQCVVMRAHSVEDGLIQVCGDRDGELLVLGRRALGTGPSWLRLGPVARHLVHRLPTPVVVVPRDWRPPKTPGPVLAMVAADPSSRPALAAADRHARAMGVPLVVAHAIADPERELRPYFPPSAIEDLRIQRRAREGGEFQRWFAEQRIDARPIVELGSARSLAAELVERERPSVVVVGSRRLTMRDRWFGSSTSTDLAGHLDAPVLVVPF